MLYFTFAEGSTKGIFSGRFVFKVHGVDDGNADDLVNSVESDSIAKYGRTLAHEKAHHSASHHSRLGTYLVGLRFLARLFFALGIHKPIHRYYEKRTIYFVLTYAFHEVLVDRITRRHHLTQEPLEPTSRETFAVRRLDQRISSLPLPFRFATLPLPINPLYGIGILTTKEFGVVLSVRDESSRPKLIEASTRTGYAGIFNSAFQPSKQDNRTVRLIKAVHRNINIERISHFLGKTFSEDRIACWTEIKLQAEFDAIRLLYEGLAISQFSDQQLRTYTDATERYSSCETYFKRYLEIILPFALKYQGIEPCKICSELEALIKNIVQAVAERDFSILTPQQKSHLSLAGGLFFYHGN